MAVFIKDCPHCRSKNMTFRIFGAAQPPQLDLMNGRRTNISVGAECQECWRPVSASLIYIHAVSNSPAYQTFTGHFASLTKELAGISTLSFQLDDLWPKPEPARIPDHLPSVVERAFVQGEINFALAGCEDAAATMYRRALDTALKDAHPTVKGDLFKKIEALVEANVFPKSLGEWAHEVRIIGNDGAHDIEGATSADVRAARDFVDAVLRYTYSLPGAIAERRGEPEPRAPEETPGEGAAGLVIPG